MSLRIAKLQLDLATEHLTAAKRAHRAEQYGEARGLADMACTNLDGACAAYKTVARAPADDSARMAAAMDTEATEGQAE